MFWLKFTLGLNLMFLLFLGMVMYGYEIETKENKIQNKDKIELQQIHVSYIAFTRRATCTLK